jgi:hypothetical protein
LLEKYAGKTVLSARQHYLKYRLPDTYQNMIQAGIQHDYSCVLYHDSGFKNGIAHAYPWFDLSLNTETSLTIHPGMLMDVALKNYMKLNPLQALEEIHKMISITRKYNATFILVWHNSSLCEAEQWKGWTSVFLQTLELLKNAENES